ncbi:branched-chain amino acid ABC transporter substrate-binding protein [Roseateles amylovorans]|uniref:Branched-chain amino acid ABC transporter substrate-binding protein n=1 Tax=Roseateles amylovorans TaxID=2978473 RepID=A0ABY6B6K6_9BURK|nr:branched-chain amino acid ABC transporter substrate-binding protein [Roseateles amylovorans]UXH80896.1 branched-chain amino acid ABC transporter substrate-binding protein [Roseateles amylovorans]
MVAMASALPSSVSAAEPIRLALIEGLSGPLGNGGEAVFRNLVWATERINARGGVKLPGGARPLALLRFDSKGSVEESLSMLRAATDQGVRVVLQGNSSAVAGALIAALDKHNAREPEHRALFLNYAAVDPALTNAQCSFWHFRFDADTDMRLAALVEVIAQDRQLKTLYLINQDYSFGQHLQRQARAMLAQRRPDLQIVGDDLHPLGRVKDFMPYASKIRSSGAQAVLTGNWGNDLTLLIKAAKDLGLDTRFYTFYGNALGVPGVLGEAGVDRVLAVAEWHPNVGTPDSERFYAAFRQRFPKPEHDYLHARMQLMVEMLVAAMEKAGSDDPIRVAKALEGLRLDGRPLGVAHQGWMRPTDHQLQQPLYVSVMRRVGEAGVPHDNEGSGVGFRTLRYLEAGQAQQPTACRMRRPE